MSPQGEISAEQRQRQYYAETAAAYDDMHVDDGDEHFVALSYISPFVRALDATRVLDVGAGTGRNVSYYKEHFPGAHVVGVEPVPQLLEQAVKSNGVDPRSLIVGSGFALPFPDDSFDVVSESAVLHHVPNPGDLIAEMTRVAKRAVFLSDSNRYGHGRTPVRLAKLFLGRAGLFPLAYALRTGGKRYRENTGDGVWYSYSVYDAYPQLAEWADRVFFVPTSAVTGRSWAHPLLNSNTALVCAIKGELEPIPDR